MKGDPKHRRKTCALQWVAEACVARKVGREVKAYKDKKDTVLELKRKRAEAKMYNEVRPSAHCRSLLWQKPFMS